MVLINKPYVYYIIKWCAIVSYIIHLALGILLILSEYYPSVKSMLIPYLPFSISMIFIPTFYIAIAGVVICLTYLIFYINI